MSEVDVTYNKFARPLTEILGMGDMNDSGNIAALQKILSDIDSDIPVVLNVSKEAEADTELLGELTAVTNFRYVNTFDETTEVWSRKHQNDGQLTKVHINFITGEVRITKEITERELSHRRPANGRKNASKQFTLREISDIRRVCSYAFL